MKAFFGKFSPISRDLEIFTVPLIVSSEKISVGIYPIGFQGIVCS